MKTKKKNILGLGKDSISSTKLNMLENAKKKSLEKKLFCKPSSYMHF